MREKLKFIIIEAILLIVLVISIWAIFSKDINLGIFRVISKDTLLSQYNQITELNTRLHGSEGNYDSVLKSVETSITEFGRQKEQYEAISDETIAIIKEATTEEKYSIEYMWVKLGNYAKANNLSLTLLEPGAIQTPSTQTPTAESEQGTVTAMPQTSNELQINVKGNYIDISSFIFELENDTELRFKLDRIKMEYAGNNKIDTTFVVKNLKFVK